ncbi:GrpB family protein [Streptomyces benahoarensis]|uniref:GrpB family protein n=1 Tax=Streptomyces benahoarensis TaxID=2595054 RepID=UPI0020351617|nr:GrpB family protein [Streptomyces benahoarensis]
MPFDDETAPVAVVAYRPCWPREFTEHAVRLRALLGDLAVAVDHVGPTSVPVWRRRTASTSRCGRHRSTRSARSGPRRCWRRPGSSAAPSRGTAPRSRPATAAANWSSPRPPAPAGARRCTIHLREHGGPNARYALLFRDHLRADAAARRAWGTFKQRLAAQVPDLAAYGQIKEPATEALMLGAERWAAATGWAPS